MNPQPVRHGDHAPSPWIVRFAGLIPAGGAVLDVAAGSGRHSTLLSLLGHPVTAIDRDAAALATLVRHGEIEIIAADLETGDPWPLGTRRFAGVVVTNYLYRPLFGPLIDAVAPGGALLYETFAIGNERFGKPSNPDFLLRPGELLDLVRGRLRVIAYEDVQTDTPKPAMVQRIAAVNETR